MLFRARNNVDVCMFLAGAVAGLKEYCALGYACVHVCVKNIKQKMSH